ncbi:Molecular chaperone IbpA, HSP20 family [Noviherbaspirillum humi]|uniref:Molecular chaperone IbpA, HSP20 family n=1 Tax=Noviherbaspirillum humi TaxID=1688639 RepID=A0A239KKW9_9BURK|nr:Hsp20/alpha crystallin family protein [Noviherbaspirillum humi]SNT18342.1 Molecular chaperone IbpA, HSP20 family [Noviherbaspirillum humi]
MSSHDPTRSMWADSLAMLERIDKLHRHCFQLSISSSRGPTWEPPVDVFETERELILVLALPGVPAETVNVLIDGGTIAIVGERRIPVPASAVVRRMEIPYGRFERRIDLPPGLFEIQRRELSDGCLLLSLRKLR